MEPKDPVSLEGRLSTMYKRSEVIIESYLGALHVLDQEYHDQSAHFAQSLREVIDQLAMSNSDPECKPLQFGTKPRQPVLSTPPNSDPQCKKLRGVAKRRCCLQKTFDEPGERQSVDHLLDMLARTYGRLSRVAHHGEEISKAQARGIMAEVEEALDRLTNLPKTLDSELAEMLAEPPSLDSARRIAALPVWQTPRSYLIDRVHERWLPHLKKAGFFENPPPTDGSLRRNYERWAPAIYLEKCTQTNRTDVADIILSCPFPERPNPAVYTDFLRCAAVLPDSLESVGCKAIREAWDRLMWHDSFRASYVAVAEKLASQGKYDVATCMLCRALKPGPPPGAATGIFEPVGPIISYKFLRDMPKRAKKNPPPVIALMDSLLHESLAAYKRGKRADRGRECCFSDPEETGLHGATEVMSLFNCIQNCVVEAKSHKDGTEAAKVLCGMDHCLYRRLELHVYAVFSDKFSKEIEPYLRRHYGSMHECPEYQHHWKALPYSTRREIEALSGEGHDLEA